MLRAIPNLIGRSSLPVIAAFCLLLAVVPAFAVSTLTDTSASPHARVQAVGLEEVQWTDGFWADRMTTLRERSIPAMWEIMKGDQYKPYLQHFLIAAGDMEGRFRGAPFNDGDFYKFIEAVCVVWAQTNDPELEAILDQSIDAISRAQREDGYLHTPVLIARRNGDESARPFQDRHNFEMYNMGHLLTTACVHHRVTGRDDLLAIAKRTADFLQRTFENPTPELARNSVCPSHYMGMIELYRTTGDPRHLALARQFVEMRDLVTDGGDDNQDLVPFFAQREAVGHAVRANYLYAGAADLMIETGDERYWKPLRSIWENVVQRKMYLTGACGALYDGASPFGSSRQTTITRTHQAYGHDYELPNTTAHGETCAAIGNVLWNWRMFLATGEARFLDVLELTLYNSVLSGVSLEGSDYFYTNPLRVTDPLPIDLRWSRARVPYVTSFCCPPNVLRTIAEAGAYAYARSPGTLWVNLYGGNTVTTTIENVGWVSLTQESDYPWKGRVRLTVNEADGGEFTLNLRIPAWAGDARLSINQRTESLKLQAGAYASIKRAWKPGDVLELELPMEPRLIEANPLVEEILNQVAVKRGPIVYCLESADLPEGVRVGEVSLPADVQLTAQNDPQLLDGVVALTGTGEVREAGDWSGHLYRELRDSPTKAVDIRLVPYYAWGNRGPGEMSVWLPRAR
ncbi:MAG TPA: ATP-binding protein [Verrucomicrobiales bacterium]|nr:ATP-binding protein [Verrucomicrobiales bacterium]